MDVQWQYVEERKRNTKIMCHQPEEEKIEEKERKKTKQNKTKQKKKKGNKRAGKG